MVFRIINPVPISTSDGLGVNRDIPQDIILRRLKETPLQENELDRFDRHTIFNDIIWSECAKKFLFVAPPLLNLASHVFPIRLIIEDSTKEAKLLDVSITASTPVCTLMESEIYVGDPERDRIRISFANGSTIIPIKKVTNQNTAKNIVLSTMQKDCDPIWLMDWIYYHYKHGIKNFCIYDNGSQNRDQIIASLSVFDDANIDWIDWPFPYGIFRAENLAFAQSCQINHSMLMNRGSDWLLNLDIDEYLKFSPGKNIGEIIANFKPEHGRVEIMNYMAPIFKDNQQKVFRAKDFKSYYEIDGGKKNIFRPQSARIARIHRVDLNKGYTVYSGEDSNLKIFHFRGVGRNWKTEDHNFPGKRLTIDRVSKYDLIEDDYVQRFFKDSPH